MTTATSQPAPAPPPRQKKKHWFLRILAVVGVLLLLVFITVEVVLSTDLPRGIVVGQIEKQLALRLTVKSLKTGWLGYTELHDVTIALPLADKAFLEVPVMKVKNTSLFGLILGRSVEVEYIELDQPHLHVWQASDGTWNIEEVAKLLARAAGQKPGEASAQSSSTPAMPNIHLAAGIITIIDNKNRAVELQPLTVDGYRDTGVSWKYDIQIPPRLGITGRLVPGGDWEHEVALKIQDIAPWAKPWTNDFPPVNIDAKWHGALSETGVGGRLDLTNVSVGLPDQIIKASGAMVLAVTGGMVTVRPDNLLLKTGQTRLPELKLASGTINFNTASKDLKLENLLISLFGGTFKANADYNLSAHAGRLDAGWENLAVVKNTGNSGAITATISQPFPDKFVLAAHVTSTGTQNADIWQTSIGFSAVGQSATSFDWTVNADKLQWQRHKLGINLNGLALNGSLRDKAVMLHSIGLPRQDLLAGSAAYHFTGDKSWEVHLQGQHWPFKPVPGTELAFELKARGNQLKVFLDNLVLKSPDAQFSANGTYVYNIPKPLMLNVSVTNAPPNHPPAAVASTVDAKLVNGTIEGHASLTGTLDPLDLDLRGNVDGREIDIRGHHLGDFNLVLSKDSHINQNGTFLHTETMALLGGKWGIGAEYLFNSSDVQVDLDLENVSIADAARMAGANGLSGTIGGKISLIIPESNTDPNALSIPPALFTLRDIASDGVVIDQIDATVSLDNGYLQVNPIHLAHGKGTGDLRLGMHFSDFRKIDLAANIARWPIDIQGAAAHLDAWADIPSAIIQLPNPKSPDRAARKLRISADQIDLRGDTTLKGDKLGDMIVHAGIDGRKLDLRALHMTMLGGRFDGQAYADLDHLLRTTAEFTWEKIDMRELALIIPQVNEFSGKLTGNIRLAPTTVPRPLEPLAVVATIQFTNGAWRTLAIQDARIAAYVGQSDEEAGAGWRIVLDDSKTDRNFIHAADGTIELWARFASHSQSSSSLAQVIFRDLNLDKIVHAIDPTAGQMPGRLAGSLLLIRAPVPVWQEPPSSAQSAFPGRLVVPVSPIRMPSPHDAPLRKLIEPIYGEGRVNLTQANLANFGPFAFLYNAARLGQDVSKPEGEGDVQFHLERGTLSIDHLRYSNRGTEIRAVATLDKLWLIPKNPITGSAVLTARPLQGVKLPFISDVDTALTAIQQSLALTAAKFSGNLEKPKTVPLRASELNEQLRTLIVGDAKGTKQ